MLRYLGGRIDNSKSNPIDQVQERANEITRLWGSAVSVHPGLATIVSQGSEERDFDNRIRDAFILLETRMREIGGLSKDIHGADLADALFSPKKGILQPVTEVSGENAGVHQLFHGAFLYLRNPNAHHFVKHDQQSAWILFHFVNYLLQTLEVVAVSAVNVQNYLSPHEGRIRRYGEAGLIRSDSPQGSNPMRKDFRLDIDGDNENELVVLLDMGGIAGTEGRMDREYGGTLLPLILDKQGEKYRRMPCEAMPGTSFYGAWIVRAYNITGASRPDLVITWGTGISGSILFTERWADDHYEICHLEVIADLKESWGGLPPDDEFFLHHVNYQVDFVDFDGDGINEIIQGIRIHDPQLSEMGYQIRSPGDYITLYRVWKWDETKNLLTLRSQRAIATPPSFSAGGR